MNQKPFQIYVANYLREHEKINIKVQDLNFDDELLWNEVEELLKDNNLWDDEDNADELEDNTNESKHNKFNKYYKYAKRIYAVTTNKNNFNFVSNNEQRESCLPEIEKVINSGKKSLYKYMYVYNYFSEYRKYNIELPNFMDGVGYNYLIIFLKNDDVIIGRCKNISSTNNVKQFYYHGNNNKIPFHNLNDLFSGLIVEKLLEEKQRGLNMDAFKFMNYLVMDCSSNV